MLSKGSPGTASTATNLAGFGFEPDEGFKTGDLSLKWRFLNASPMPPVISSAVQGETDPISVGFNVAGFNPFPVNPRDTLAEAFEEDGTDESDTGLALLRVPLGTCRELSLLSGLLEGELKC